MISSTQALTAEPADASAAVSTKPAAKAPTLPASTQTLPKQDAQSHSAPEADPLPQ